MAVWALWGRHPATWSITPWSWPLPQDRPGIFSAGLDLTEMCGKSPAHYAEYWKAVQELWLRLYPSNLVLVAAINVSVPRTDLVWGLIPPGPDRPGKDPPAAGWVWREGGPSLRFGNLVLLVLGKTRG